MFNEEMEIDVIGQYYTSINNRKQPGVFALSVYLKEFVNPNILQQAANDLMRRLPFMNGRVKRGFFNYKYEIVKTFSKVEPDGKDTLFCDYYNKGSHHMIKIVYGKQYFTVNTTHSICDGRGLSKFTRALIVRYFELIGVKIDKGDIINCEDNFDLEEAEDAAKRYASRPTSAYVKKEDEHSNVKAYRLKYSRLTSQQVLTQSFDADKIKAAAKAHNVTISEYILGHIFNAAAIERNTTGGKGPIVATIPIDCRSFFKSKTLRSFVSSIKITMPKSQDFSELVRQIKTQFNEITKDTVQNQLYELEKLYHSARFVPRVLKTMVMKNISRLEAKGATTGLSNLGLIKLPHEVESRIERLEFPMSIEQDTPVFFSCVTFGNTLSLSATFRKEGQDMVKTVINNLKVSI